MADTGVNLAWRLQDDLMVIVHNEHPPSDAEWTANLREYEKTGSGRRVRVLVYTAGGAPNARQRQALNRVLGSAVEKPRIAVMTSSSLARAAATAVSWFNPTFKMFSQDEIELALDHLDCSSAERTRARRILDELKSKLGCP